MHSIGSSAAVVGLVARLVSYLRSPPSAAKIKNTATENPPNTLSEYPAGMRFKTTNDTDCLPIRTGPEGKSKVPACTVHDLFLEILDKGKGKHPALRTEMPCPEFSVDPSKDTQSKPL